LDGIKEENNVKLDILTTLREANKSSSKDVLTDKDYIIKKNELIKNKIVQENDSIKKCENFLNNSTLITDKTRLIFDSLVKMMGKSESDQEMKNLSNKDTTI